MLHVADLEVRFAETIAVRDVDVSLSAGSVLAVLGPSGCGKSTLLRAIAGLEPPTRGRIEFDGQDLALVPTHRRGFALMFQDGQLFNHLSVAGNIAYALRLRRVGKQTARKRVGELLDLVGMPGYDDRMPATLSGGERQRVALARALAVPPRLLLLDEPLSALDATLRERLAGDLRRILVESQITALLVTHDHDEAFAVADRIAVMRSGEIVQQGGISEVWAAPVDPETALFLGYASIHEGDAAGRILAAAGLGAAPAVALRRSALTIAAQGPLTGRVRSVSAGPDQVRLVVEVDAIGTADAVAPVGGRVTPGDRVALRVDPDRLARLGHR